MGMNDLKNLMESLKFNHNEICVEKNISRKAMASLQRMLDFHKQQL
jgi:quinolinate synthase